ncbi:MAG: hypothetical protein WCD89_17000 [Anaerocolumna sp.]
MEIFRNLITVGCGIRSIMFMYVPPVNKKSVYLKEKVRYVLLALNAMLNLSAEANGYGGGIYNMNPI